MLLNVLTSVCSLGNLRYALYVEGNTEITLKPVYFLIIMLAEAGIGKSFWITFFLSHPIEAAIEREVLSFFAQHEEEISEKQGKSNGKSPSLVVDNGTLAAYTTLGGLNATTLGAWRASADVRASLETLAPTSMTLVAKSLQRLHEDPDLYPRRTGKVPLVTISFSSGEPSVALRFGGDGALVEEGEEEEEGVATSSYAPELKGNTAQPSIIISVCNAETAVAVTTEGTFKSGVGGAWTPDLAAQAFICAAATTELGKSARAGDGGSARNSTGGVGSSFHQVTSTQPGTYHLMSTCHTQPNGYFERILAFAPIVGGTVRIAPVLSCTLSSVIHLLRSHRTTLHTSSSIFLPPPLFRASSTTLQKAGTAASKSRSLLPSPQRCQTWMAQRARGGPASVWT